MSITQTVAGNIRAEAARAGLNQSDLARALNIAQSSISLRWRGERPWSLELLEQVAEILNMPPLDLVRARRDSNPQPSNPEDDTTESGQEALLVAA